MLYHWTTQPTGRSELERRGRGLSYSTRRRPTRTNDACRPACQFVIRQDFVELLRTSSSRGQRGSRGGQRRQTDGTASRYRAKSINCLAPLTPIHQRRRSARVDRLAAVTGRIARRSFTAPFRVTQPIILQLCEVLRCMSVRQHISNKSSAVAEMGDRLATIDMGRKVGADVPLSVGELGSHLTQYRLRRGLPPYQVLS